MPKAYNVIDLFCGAGGLSEGFRLAGFNIIKGIDFDKSSIQTYNKNFGEGKGICADISNITKSEITKLIPEINMIDVVIGGPPCQGFSSANRYKKRSDSRNNLFAEFIKFVEIANPKAVVIENVKGILTENNGQIKKDIENIFRKMGYEVSQQLLKAVDYGVPQKRIRNFFVMVQNKKFDFDEIEKSKIEKTVKAAIGDLYKYEKSIGEEVANHKIVYPATSTQEKMSHVQQGGNWKDIPKELFPKNRTNRHSSAYKRLKESEPSCTIDTGNNHCNYYHPLYNRIPTVRESARIQSFTDNFIFIGSRSEQYRQVGNAVPPLLAYAIAKQLQKELSNE